MPELLSSALLSLGGEALFSGAADAALSAGGDAALGAGLDAGFGAAGDLGLSALTGAGLPFAAGAGQLGSVAAAGGPLGFSDALGLIASLSAGGAGAFGGDLAAAGLPFAAGAGEIGAGAGAGGFDLGSILGATTGAFGGADAAALPAAAGLTAGGPISGIDLSSTAAGLPAPQPTVTPEPGVFSSGGLTSVGPTAGTPPAPLAAGGGSGAAGAAAVAPPAGAGPLDLTSLLGKAGGALTANPLGTALAAGGLGYNIFKGQQDSAATGDIRNSAANIAAQVPGLNAKADALTAEGAGIRDKAGQIVGTGQEMAQYLKDGTLPPGMEAQVGEQLKAARAKIVSNYAAQGMNTDPNRNSSLRQDLEGLERQGPILRAKLAQELLSGGTGLINAGTGVANSGTNVTNSGTSLVNSGLTATGLQNNLLTALSNIDSTQTARIGSAIANFASALNGNKGGLTVNLGGQKAA